MWRDLKPDAEIAFISPIRYRTKPKPRRIWVRVYTDDGGGYGDIFEEKDLNTVKKIVGTELIEFVEVIK